MVVGDRNEDVETMDQDVIDSIDGHTVVNLPPYIHILRQKYRHHDHYLRALEAYKHHIKKQRDALVNKTVPDEMNLEKNTCSVVMASSTDLEPSSHFELDSTTHDIDLHSLLSARIILPNDDTSLLCEVKGQIIGIEDDEALIILFCEDSNSYYAVLCHTKLIPKEVCNVWKSIQSKWHSACVGDTAWGKSIPFNTSMVFNPFTSLMSLHNTDSTS